MKKIYAIILLLLFFSFPSYALDWLQLQAKNGTPFELDVDSISEIGNYYFYNIKVINIHTNKDVVITMQSGARNGLSSRINFYTPQEYERLQGDYEHIADNSTRNFEPVEYGSVAYAAYTKVKSIILSKKIQIKI